MYVSKFFFCIVPVTIECYLNFIKKVTAAKSEEELVSLKQNVMLVDSLVHAGWLKDLTLGNRNLAMQTIMVHFVLHKRKEPFFQLCKGLKTLGVLELVKAFPDLMRRYFVMAKKKIDSNEMIGLFCMSDGCSESPDVESA